MEIIEKYLKNKTEILNSNKFIFNNKPINTKVAVIVEPRNHYLLEDVVKNVMSSLGEDWNLHIFCYDQNFILNLFKNCSFTITLLNKNNLTIDEYNKLFQSIEFWNTIKEETILIFQTDSFIMNPSIKIDKFLKYSFIGGIYRYITTEKLIKKYNKKIAGYIGIWEYLDGINLNNSAKIDFSINGGFSIRKKSIMIKCLQNVSNNDIIKYRIKNKLNTLYYETNTILSEDTYFQNAIDILGLDLPDKQTCIEFCENLSYTNINLNSFGIHQVKDGELLNRFKNEIEKKFI